MLLSVTHAEYIGNYSIKLSFSNGENGVEDLKDIIFNDHRKIFEPLRNQEYFKSFQLENWTILWSNNLDLAPEFLYNLKKS